MAITPKNKAKAALASAQALLTERSAAVVGSQLHIDSLRLLLAQGDASISATDLASAAFEIERAELLENAAINALAAAVRADAAANIDQDLANAIAPVLTLAAGLPVKVVEADKVPNDFSGITLPALYLIQRSLTERDVLLGSIAGRVEVCYVGSIHHVALNTGVIEQKMREHGTTIRFRNDGYTLNKDEGTRLTYVEADVPSTTELVPVVSGSLPSYRMDYFRQTVDHHVAGWLSLGGSVASGIKLGNGDAAALTNTVNSAISEVGLVDTSIKGGLRTLTISATATAYCTGQTHWTNADLAQHLQNALEALAGGFHPAFGRVSEAIVTRRPGEGNSVVAIVTCKIVSQQGLTE